MVPTLFRKTERGPRYKEILVSLVRPSALRALRYNSFSSLLSNKNSGPVATDREGAEDCDIGKKTQSQRVENE